WTALLVLAALCASCEGNRRKPVFPARGQILFDGKPAAGATVFFQPVVTEPDGIAPYAVTDASGAFRLTTYLTYDGAPAGEYVVTVRYPGPPRRGSDEDQGPDRLVGRYADVATSPLRATIEKKPNEFTFEVSGKKK